MAPAGGIRAPLDTCCSLCRTVEVFELKVDTNCCLSENINTYEYQRSRSIWPLSKVALIYILKHCSSQAAGHIIDFMWSLYDRFSNIHSDAIDIML